MKNSERIENIKKRASKGVLSKKTDIQLNTWLGYLDK